MSFSGVHYLAYNCSDEVHLLSGKPVASSEVTGGAGRTDVTSHMGEGVIYTVKPPRTFASPAIYAGLPYKFENLGSCKVARIYSLVCLAKEHCTTFVGLAVLLVAGLSLSPLFGGHVNPTLFPAVAPLLAGVVAWLALVRQSKLASFFSMEVFSSSCETAVTTKASAVRHIRKVYGPHERHKE